MIYAQLSKHIADFAIYITLEPLNDQRPLFTINNSRLL